MMVRWRLHCWTLVDGTEGASFWGIDKDTNLAVSAFGARRDDLIKAGIAADRLAQNSIVDLEEADVPIWVRDPTATLPSVFKLEYGVPGIQRDAAT